MDIVEDHRISSPEDSLFEAEISEEVKKLLSILTEREQRVLRMRFGIDLGSSYTLEEVGQRFGMTREGARRIQVRAFRKIRHHFPEARELLQAIISR